MISKEISPCKDLIHHLIETKQAVFKFRVPGTRYISYNIFIKICDRHHEFEMIGIHTKVSFYKSLHLCGRFARKICCLFLPESYEILLMSQHFCWGVSFSCTCSSTFFCFMWNENGNTSWLKYFLQTYWRFAMAAMTPYVLRSWSKYHDQFLKLSAAKFLRWIVPNMDMSWLSGRATRESAPRSGTGRQKIISLKLTICHWKRMVGRLLSCWDGVFWGKNC